jgi:hypothetical protein
MIDWTRVDDLRAEIGADDLTEVVALFLLECDETVGRFGDGDRIGADTLHFLKGAALNLGFSALARACAEGEAACHAGQPPAAAPILAIYRRTRADFAARLGLAGDQTGGA